MSIFGDGGAGKAAQAQAQAAEKSAQVTSEANRVATAESARQFDISSAMQKDALDRTLALQESQNAQAQSNIAPWLTTGTQALSKLASLYGIQGFDGDGAPIGSPTPSGTEDFYKSPDYNFRFNEGMKGINANALARGNLDSGATIKAAANYASNLAGGEWNNYVNRLASLAGVGQTAAGSANASGQQYAANAGNAITGSADAVSRLGSSYADRVGNLAIGNANAMSNIYTTQGNNTANAYLAAGQRQQSMFGNLLGLGVTAATGGFGDLGLKNLFSSSQFGGGAAYGYY